ncbi:MAG: peptidylprolyl isomerase [Alicyclobacillus sp.]|nr:peptidylprolyl isomerase [Alicyclobacillus sp.]
MSARHHAHPPAMQLVPGVRYQAVIRTSEGDFTVELLSQKAPLTVNNFVALARDGYYDGVVFHRIVPDFVIQTGDPTGTGAGGPGYQFPDELPPAVPYEPGVVAMANAGPDTNGSQFFICTGEHSRNLNRYPHYTVFGIVSEGMEVVQAIAQTPVGPNSMGELSRPLRDVRIATVDIVEHRRETEGPTQPAAAD